MKTLPPSIAAHISSDLLSTALCWTVLKSTGGTIRGTDHDRDITIVGGAFAGTYLSVTNITGSDVRGTSDLSVDNTEVETVGADTQSDGITFAEVEAGIIDGSKVVVFMCDWRNPSGGQVILRKGYMGEVSRDSDFRLRTEVRGLTQLLAQQIGRVLSDRCDVIRFGDSRCKFNVAAITSTGTVTAVTNRKLFTVDFGTDANWDILPPGGEVTFSSGANAGFTKEVKLVTENTADVDIELYEEMPDDVQVGDVLDLIPGCDRRYATCKARDNLVNFRGYGVFVPGALALMRGAAPGDCQIVLPDSTEVT